MGDMSRDGQSFLDKIEAESTEAVSPAEKVYVYEGPVRAWHWANALCIVVLCATGYFIGDPLPSVGDDASNQFVMGYIRMAHFSAGQIITVMLIGRIFWAFVGNMHARQVFLLPVWSRKWWGEIIFEMRWYSLLVRDPKKYVGHNPLAQFAMFFMFMIPLLIQVFTGFALYAEGHGTDSTWYAVFGWVFALTNYDSFTIHVWHRIMMWVIILFTMVHVYAAVREDIMSRQSLISTMVSGWRYFKDDRE